MRKKLVNILEQHKFKVGSKKQNLILDLVANLQEYEVEKINIADMKKFHILHPFIKYLKLLKKFIKSSRYLLLSSQLIVILSASLKERNKLMLEFSELELKIIIPRRIRNASVIIDKQRYVCIRTMLSLNLVQGIQ